MSRDPLFEPEQLSGYTGEQEPRPEDTSGPAPTTGGTDAEGNRGTPAPQTGSGGVVGSGASAGGGGGPEDYDSDPQGGGGAVRMRHPEPTPEHGGDGAKHGSR
jgi:hypothetical protein